MFAESAVLAQAQARMRHSTSLHVCTIDRLAIARAFDIPALEAVDLRFVGDRLLAEGALERIMTTLEDADVSYCPNTATEVEGFAKNALT